MSPPFNVAECDAVGFALDGLNPLMTRYRQTDESLGIECDDHFPNRIELVMASLQGDFSGSKGFF
jgi:hypothetical protein